MECFKDLLFFRSYFYPLGEILSTSVSFCSWIYIEDSPKLPWGMQRICGPSSWIILSFDRLLLLCQALIRFLYFIQVYIFIPPIHSAHYCAFHTFCLHQFLHVYIIITMRIFFFLLMALISAKLGISFQFLILAVKGLTWTIFYFLKFIVLNFHNM